MIKPHEIQIGSIVLRDGVPSVVKWITETHLGGIPLGGFDPREWSYEEIQGIAINHQLAEQLGFEIQDQDDFDTRYDKHIDKKLISLSIEHGGQCWLSIYTPMYDYADDKGRGE